MHVQYPDSTHVIKIRNPLSPSSGKSEGGSRHPGHPPLPTALLLLYIHSNDGALKRVELAWCGGRIYIGCYDSCWLQRWWWFSPPNVSIINSTIIHNAIHCHSPTPSSSHLCRIAQLAWAKPRAPITILLEWIERQCVMLKLPAKKLIMSDTTWQQTRYGWKLCFFQLGRENVYHIVPK